MRHIRSLWAVQVVVGVFAVFTLGQPSARAQSPCGTDCWQADTCERADVQAAVAVIADVMGNRLWDRPEYKVRSAVT